MRGFQFFACHLDLGTRSNPIRLQFADGHGAFFECSLGIKQIAARAGVFLNMEDSVDMKIAVQSHVLNMDGIESLRSGMKRNRVPAKTAHHP